MLRPFRIEFPDAEVEDLRARLGSTRWPPAQPVDDWSQGVPLGYLIELCDFWSGEYDWRATEVRLNRLPQILTAIDGVDIHAVHVRSPHPDATPLILTHGWPGSFLEFEGVLAALTEPELHGGASTDAFHVVVPSLPGYGLSGKPTVPGWGIHRIARAWVELMTRLGHDQFVAGGSDWGTSISTSIAMQAPERLLGLVLVPPLAAPGTGSTDLSDGEREALAELDERSRTGSGYSAVQATRPQTLGYGLTDSPAGLCAWIIEKIWTWADHPGDLEQVLSRQQVLDNVSLYWLTRTAATSGRLYWESIEEVTRWFTSDTQQTVAVPTAGIVFPAEVPRPSRRWAARRFTNIVHWGTPARGGHFGAWEQPELFMEEVRAARRALVGGG